MWLIYAKQGASFTLVSPKDLSLIWIAVCPSTPLRSLPSMLYFASKLMIDNFYPTHIEVQQVYLLLNFVLILILDVYRVSA